MGKREEREELLSQLEERTSARGLLNYAHEYYASYELIQSQRPKMNEYFAVKYYLLCHALELTMKAWLRHKGATYKELKTLGHDLERIMTVLYEQHQLLFSAEIQAMISLVNQHYSQKEFEYALKGTKTVPEITDLAGSVALLQAKARFDIQLDGDPRRLRELNDRQRK